MVASLHEQFAVEFDRCRTVGEVGEVYKRLFAAHDDSTVATRDTLQEAYRRAFVRFVQEEAIARTPHDPNRVRPHELRNWCRVQGIPLAKRGKVSVAIENQYREAHDMAPLPAKEKPERKPREKKERAQRTPRPNTDGLDMAAIRAWGRAQGMSVGQRGRLHPDLINKYLAEAGK